MIFKKFFEIKKKMSCSICYEELTTSVPLSCGHEFCEECINRWFEEHPELRCPYCRQSITLAHILDLSNQNLKSIDLTQYDLSRIRILKLNKNRLTRLVLPNTLTSLRKFYSYA